MFYFCYLFNVDNLQQSFLFSFIFTLISFKGDVLDIQMVNLPKQKVL